MKILIADKLPAKAIAALENMGADVTVSPELTAEEIPSVINDSTILIVRSTKVFAETVEAGHSLELIIRAGADVTTIDLEAASDHGVYVANCPDKNSVAIAELALGLIIAVDRRIVDATNDLRDGQWKRKEYQDSLGLKGRTLGIIGLGAIGTSLAKRAQAMGMNVIGFEALNPGKADELDITLCDSINDLAKNSDVVSVHLAITADTKQLLNGDFFDNMKDGAIFVNTSRGEIVHTESLRKAMTEKNVRVALDVFENEPTLRTADFDQAELAQNITCTPHIGAFTEQASEAIANEAVRIVSTLIKTGKPINTVNAREKSETGTVLVVRHYNRVGVLASILDLLREGGINVQDMDNCIFSGEKAAVATLKLDRPLQSDLISKIDHNDSVIQASTK